MDVRGGAPVHYYSALPHPYGGGGVAAPAPPPAASTHGPSHQTQQTAASARRRETTREQLRRLRVPPDMEALAQAACLERRGGFTFPADERFRAELRAAAINRDHYHRVRRIARSMPEVAAKLGGEDVIVELMYSPLDEAPVAPPPSAYYSTYIAYY